MTIPFRTAGPALSRGHRIATVLLGLTTLFLGLPGVALGHAVVFPQTSTPRAYEKYVLRVPNERDVPTTRIELRFPSEVRVVSFGDVLGWTLTTVTDSAGNITGAVWTGTLPPERFVELPFVAVNPETDATLVWPAFQSYADGERVEWGGPADSERPAASTRIAATGEAGEGTGSETALYLAGGALLLALLSLGVALRK
jgi:uncharacterized protein YcnI